MINSPLLWLVGAAISAQALPPPPTPAEIAQAKASLQRDAEIERAAIDSAIKHRLLSGGYFQLITDQAEQASVRMSFQKRLRSIGLPVSVGNCDWIGLVAQGTATGNRSYGGACPVKIGPRPAQNFLICEADLGGVTLIEPAWYAFDANYIEKFIRRTCL